MYIPFLRIILSLLYQRISNRFGIITISVNSPLIFRLPAAECVRVRISHEAWTSSLTLCVVRGCCKLLFWAPRFCFKNYALAQQQCVTLTVSTWWIGFEALPVLEILMSGKRERILHGKLRNVKFEKSLWWLSNGFEGQISGFRLSIFWARFVRFLLWFL